MNSPDELLNQRRLLQRCFRKNIPPLWIISRVSFVTFKSLSPTSHLHTATSCVIQTHLGQSLYMKSNNDLYYKSCLMYFNWFFCPEITKKYTFKLGSVLVIHKHFVKWSGYWNRNRMGLTKNFDFTVSDIISHYIDKYFALHLVEKSHKE